MTLLSRYISMTIIKFILLVLVIVLGMEFFILLIGEFNDIGHGKYGLAQALLYVALSSPGNLYGLFPMVGLLGSLIGLGLLGSHAELIIMRTAGMSVWKIILSVLQAALLMTILITLIGEWIAPVCQHWANQVKVQAESAGQATKSGGGVWIKSGNSFVNIGHVFAGKHLEKITQYEFNAHHQLMQALVADSAREHHGQWQIEKVEISQFNDSGVKSIKKASMPWTVQLDPKLLGASRNNMSEMNLWELFNYISFRHRNGLAAGLFSLTFWQRLMTPLSSLVMIFLSVPFVFGPLRSVTMGVRIVTGAAFGFTFYLLNQFFGPFSLVYNIPPVIGASLPTVIFAVIAWFLMRRVR